MQRYYKLGFNKSVSFSWQQNFRIIMNVYEEYELNNVSKKDMSLSSFTLMLSDRFTCIHEVFLQFRQTKNLTTTHLPATLLLEKLGFHSLNRNPSIFQISSIADMLDNNTSVIIHKRKRKRSDKSYDKIPNTIVKFNRKTQMFDYTAIADRHRTVNWNNDIYQAGVVNRITGSQPSYLPRKMFNQNGTHLKNCK